MTTKSERLREFIIENLDCFRGTGGSGNSPNLPKSELYAQDYLEFAEQELEAILCARTEQNKTIHLINCVSNLKRAIDSQLEAFLYVFNLNDIFSERNLKFEKKLDFLRAAGVFSSRSLARLNSIRNKMEHEFEIPKITDIKVYYDLAFAFVAVLQRTMTFTFLSDLELKISESADKERGDFRIVYEFDQPRIIASWKIGENSEILTTDMTEPYEFGFFLRVLFLLHEQESFPSNRYFLSQLNK